VTEQLALSLDDAAAAVGMSRDSFDRHVRGQLKLIYVTERLVLVPVRELSDWVDRNARRVLELDG
jgi:hypothetical protein